MGHNCFISFKTENAAYKKVIQESVSLVQEFHDFDFESPWEGARADDLLNDDALPGDEKASAAEDTQGQEG